MLEVTRKFSLVIDHFYISSSYSSRNVIKESEEKHLEGSSKSRKYSVADSRRLGPEYGSLVSDTLDGSCLIRCSKMCVLRTAAQFRTTPIKKARLARSTLCLVKVLVLSHIRRRMNLPLVLSFQFIHFRLRSGIEAHSRQRISHPPLGPRRPFHTPLRILISELGS